MNDIVKDKTVDLRDSDATVWRIRSHCPERGAIPGLRAGRATLWAGQFQIFLLGVCLFLASSFSCPGASSSERLFLWNEANAIMASARTQEEYLIAAQSYQNLIDKGIRNGAVCYNLGTALLNAGRYENAIDALSRAERYAGSCPDIERNLDIAMARKAQREEPHIPWYRIVLFWHFKLSSPTRMAIAVAAFSLFWLFLTLKILGVRRWIRFLTVLSLLIFVLFGSSVATSWQQEMNAKRFSLLLPSESAVTPPPHQDTR